MRIPEMQKSAKYSNWKWVHLHQKLFTLKLLYLQSCALVLEFCSIYLINLVFLTKVFELYKSCHPHDHLAPNSVRLEASKKALVVHVPQGAAKLQAVKLFSFFKSYIFFYVSYCHMKTAPPKYEYF